MGQHAEDGYSWRKYGQKHVKGSEHPRSYYKCTHTDCPVKKKVERSQEGDITDVTYKGEHNHPKPSINLCIPGLLASQSTSEVQIEHGSETNMEVLTSLQDGTGSLDEGSKPLFSVSLAEESCDPLSAALYPPGKSHDFMDITPAISNEEDEDDQASRRNLPMVDSGDGEELESKRRKMDFPMMDSCAALTREPRVVVQTTSEVDILDDGYRWRKYGQKVVKGNPNPRSYYKCTSAGCNVRKHVERASHDLQSVITTYEGKHNHEVPTARSSNYGDPGTSGSSTNSLFLQSHNETVPLELSRAEGTALILEPHEEEAKSGSSTAAFALNLSTLPGGPQLNVLEGLLSSRMGQYNLAGFLMCGFNSKPMVEADCPGNAYISYNMENESEPEMSSGEYVLDTFRVPYSNQLVYEQISGGLSLDLGH